MTNANYKGAIIADFERAGAVKPSAMFSQSELELGFPAGDHHWTQMAVSKTSKIRGYENCISLIVGYLHTDKDEYRWMEERELLNGGIKDGLDAEKLGSTLLWLEKRGYVKRRTLGSNKSDRSIHYKIRRIPKFLQRVMQS